MLRQNQFAKKKEKKGRIYFNYSAIMTILQLVMIIMI